MALSSIQVIGTVVIFVFTHLHTGVVLPSTDSIPPTLLGEMCIIRLWECADPPVRSRPTAADRIVIASPSCC